MKHTPLSRTSKSETAKEKDIQKSCLDWLRWKGYIAVKFNSSIFVGSKGKEGRFIKSPQVGVSDILACSPTGQFVAIEVKRPGNIASEDQLAFLRSIRKNGGLAFVVYGIDDLEKLTSLEK